MLTREAAGIRPTSKENGPIIVARCLGIQVTPVVTCLLLQGKKIIIFVNILVVGY